MDIRLSRHSPTYAEWLRFDRYEVADGYVRPAKGASVEKYNPWDDYWDSIQPGSNRPPPYQSLLELADKLEIREDAGEFWLPPNEGAALSDWCSKHGLLGWLPHYAQAVAIAPRWQSTITGRESDTIVLTQHRLHRVGGQWVGVVEWDESPGYEDRGKGHREDELITPGDNIPKHWPNVASVSIRPATGRPARTECLSQTWGRFFPNVPEDERESYPYPVPFDEEFWLLYGEPLETFVNFAREFRDAARTLTQFKESAVNGTPSVLSESLHLNDLVAEASRAIIPLRDGQFQERWIAPSLVATFAMMLLQDLTERRRVLTCKCCDKWFVSKSPKAVYCSKTCRFRTQKRRYRAKQKDS